MKGILAMEGIPGHHEAFRSREALTGDLGAKPHSPTRARGQKPRTRRTSSPREGEGGARVNGRARQGCQRLDRSRCRGKNTPTLVEEGREAVCTRSRARCVPPKRSSDVVKRPVPRSCRTEPKTPWGVPAAKAARANRERTRCGYTLVRLGGRNRSDASRVFPAGRLQGLVAAEGR